MKRTIASLAFLTAFADVTPVRADFPKLELPRLGIFRKKKEDPPAPAPAKPTPPAPAPAVAPAQPEQTPAQSESRPAANNTKGLLESLKSDLDEKRRVQASESLRAVDPRLNADVIPTLTNSLQQDPSATVRASVAETIGKLKPTSQQAGAILEQAVVADPSEPVRKAAQQALWQYHLNGYRSTAANTAIPQTAEPPLAKPKLPPQKITVPVTTVSKQPTPSPLPPLRPITTGIGKGAIYPQTVEPPLARERISVPVVERVEPKVEVKPPLPSIVVPPLPVDPPSIPLPPTAAPLVPSIPPPASFGFVPAIPNVPASGK